MSGTKWNPETRKSYFISTVAFKKFLFLKLFIGLFCVSVLKRSQFPSKYIQGTFLFHSNKGERGEGKRLRAEDMLFACLHSCYAIAIPSVSCVVHNHRSSVTPARYPFHHEQTRVTVYLAWLCSLRFFAQRHGSNLLSPVVTDGIASIAFRGYRRSMP